VISRDMGAQRWWVCDRADTCTCAVLIAGNLPSSGTLLYTDEWQSDRGSHPAHATVRHGVHEWARDEKRDGLREVYCNTYMGAGTARSGPPCVPFGACIWFWGETERA
jgi:hypothetical protein